MTSSLVVLLDACVLINLFHAEGSDLFEGLSEYDFRITTHVQGEITDPQQVEVLQQLLDQGVLHLELITDPVTILDIEQLMKRIQAGEASSLALAKRTGWTVGTDDRKDRSITVESKPIGILTTPGLLVKAIRKGLLSVEEADGIKERLKEHRFFMAVGSFQEKI